jgi:hypothetical protein
MHEMPASDQMNEAMPAVQTRVLSSRDYMPVKRRLPWNLAEWFILSQTILPALLYLPGSQAFRVPIRVASYGIGLVALAYFWLVIRQGNRNSIRPHPSLPWLAGALAYMGLMLLHPTTNSLLAGIAQIALYLSVLAPVIWAPAFVENPARLKRLLWLLLLCNGINSFVGVMQVQDPDRWMPKEFSSVFMESDYGLGTVTYQGADGRTIIRPPGLGDAPGAVCGPAVFALFLGLVFVITGKNWRQKLAAAIFAVLGAAAIFLTLVRSSFLIAVGMVVVYFVFLVVRKQGKQAGALLVVGAVAITVAFLHSARVGGDSLTERFQTILADDPMTFYYENRGNQVAAGFVSLLPEYPFGAGLGRWGMMNAYFGNPANAASPPIWVEIQVPAWIVDGGVIMLILYPVALLVTVWQQARLTFRHPDPGVCTLAGIILASNLGLIALCSSYTVFVAPVGMQFWFLSGALHGVACRSNKSVRSRRTKAEPPAPQLAASLQPFALERRHSVAAF